MTEQERGEPWSAKSDTLNQEVVTVCYNIIEFVGLENRS